MTQKEKFENKIENLFKKDKLSKWKNVNDQFTLLSYKNNLIIKYDISSDIPRDIIVREVANRMKKVEDKTIFNVANYWYRKCVYNTLNSITMSVSELKYLIDLQPKEDTVFRLNSQNENLLIDKKLLTKALSLFDYNDIIYINCDVSKTAICISAMNDRRPFDYMIIKLCEEVKENASATKDSQ